MNVLKKMQFSYCFLFVVVSCLDHIILGSGLDKNLSFHSCTNNESISLKISATNDLNPENSLACHCKIEEIKISSIRDDYTFTPGIGLHKFHTKAKSWNEARKICNDEGGHLAIINSLAEESVSVHKL